MENCKNITLKYAVAALTLSLLSYAFIFFLYKRDVITAEQQSEADELIKEAIEIKLAYIDGKYQVDTRPKTFYIDNT
jgi:hypothetical protein